MISLTEPAERRQRPAVGRGPGAGSGFRPLGMSDLLQTRRYRCDHPLRPVMPGDPLGSPAKYQDDRHADDLGVQLRLEFF